MAIDAQQIKVNLQRANPNAGLAIASRGFGNIANSIQAHDNANDTAQHRNGILANQEQRLIADTQNREAMLKLAQDKQNYVEGEGQRRILEEERLLKNSAEQGILANEVANNAGLSRAPAMFENETNQRIMDNSPEYRQLMGMGGDATGPMTPEAQANVDQYREDFTNDPRNKRLLSDPNVYKTEVLGKLLSSGKFSRQDAEAIATQKTAALFPTMDMETAGRLLKKPGSSGSGSGSSGSSGSFKNEFSIGTPKGRADVVDRFVESRGLEKVPDNFLWTDMKYDVGRQNPTGADIAKTLARLATDGIVSSTAGEAAITEAFNADGVTLDDKFNFTTKKGYNELLKVAQRSQQQELTKTNTKSGSSGILGYQNQLDADRDYNESILGKTVQDQSTQQKRMSTFLGGLPSAPKTVAKTVPGGYIDTDGGNTPSPVVDDKSIMPAVNADDLTSEEKDNAVSGLRSLANPGAARTARGKETIKMLKRIMPDITAEDLRTNHNSILNDIIDSVSQ